MTASKKKRVQKKFLIKEDNTVYLVSDQYFADITSRTEAFNIGLQIYLEIQRVLKEEASSKDILYIGNTKVITALDRSLTAIEARYPLIMKEIISMDKRMDGQRVYRA